jgi:hypothetical protein
MSNAKVAVNRIALYAIAANGLLSACGQTSRNQGDSSGTGGSNVAGLHGGMASSSGAPSGGAAPDGGRSTGDASTGSGSKAGGGASEATGGAAETPGGGVSASGGAPGGGSNGDAGASDTGGDPGTAGGNAGTAGESGDTGTKAPSYFHAGTRLKPQVLRGGGLEVLANGEHSWFDIQIGEWCTFRLGTDGVERCYPRSAASSNYFLDARCTKPALVGSNLECDNAELTPYHYVTIDAANAQTACEGTTYRLGTPHAGGTELYSNASDSCEPVSVTEMVWPLEKVPLETFVAVERVRRPRLPNMDAWVREGADGSSEVVGFYDPARKTPCFGVGLNKSSDVCVPSWVDVQDTFADAGCTQRVGFDNPLVCQTPTSTAFLELGEDACGASRSIRGLWEIAGTRRTEVFYYSTVDQSCQRPSPPDLRTAYVQGPAIDVASLPKLDIIQVGEGSLRRHFYGFDGVPFFSTEGAFVEAASGESCFPRLFADGTWRCVPFSVERLRDVDVYYQSADCTGERLHVWQPIEECPNLRPEPTAITVEPFNGKCAVHPVTDTLEFDGPPSSSSTLFGISPFTGCRPMFDPDDRVKVFRATKVVNPAERFIPFEQTLSE